MKHAKRWKCSEDPSGKVIPALVTEVNDLKVILKDGTKVQANATSICPNLKETPKLFVPEWRIEDNGEQVTRDGAT